MSLIEPRNLQTAEAVWANAKATIAKRQAMAMPRKVLPRPPVPVAPRIEIEIARDQIVCGNAPVPVPLSARNANGQPTVLSIQRAVCRYFKLPMMELLSHRRTADLVVMRHIAFYLAKTLTLKTLPDIGRRFGDRDHTTVLHGVRKITARRLADPAMDEMIKAIEALVATV